MTHSAPESDLRPAERALYALLSLASRLPLGALYAAAELLFAALYYFPGYRRKIVAAHLTAAFPDWPPARRKKVARLHYRRLAEAAVETLRLRRMKPAELKRRVTGDVSELARLRAEGRNVVLLAGHLFNWEWGACAIPLYTDYAAAVVYAKLSNAGGGRFFRETRGVTGARLFEMREMTGLLRLMKSAPTLTALAADQTPSNLRAADWAPFFGREVPFHPGIEGLARRTGQAVAFVALKRVKRGHYRAEVSVLTENAAETEPGFILKRYIDLLEAAVREQPENYLWTHRRWKHHGRKGEVG